MKGVEQFGDFGMELSFAFMTKPGQQSIVRRRAYTMIRDASLRTGSNLPIRRFMWAVTKRRLPHPRRPRPLMPARRRR